MVAKVISEMNSSQIRILFSSVALGLLSASAAQAQIAGFSTFTLNGGATATSSVLTVTDNGGSEARSAFFNTKQSVTAFNVNFVYTASGDKAADGAAFVLQNSGSGASALGAAGGSLGYSGITPSAAFELNLYGPNTTGAAFKTNGSTGGYAATGTVNIASGDPIAVVLSYNGSVLSATLTDQTTSATYSTAYVTNLASVLGSSTAFVGFTGGTGGSAATQTISNFTFVSAPEPGSVALIGSAFLPFAGLIVRRRRA
jgi:hypothetical protein